MNGKHEDYLDKEILKIKKAASTIEREWLTSIGAPVKRLPKYVAEAVMTRFIFSFLSPGLARWFIEHIISQNIIKKALNE